MLRTIVTSAFAAVLAPAALAQCADWSPDFVHGGLNPGQAAASAVFDDGSGPNLYVAGSSITGTENLATYGIVRWNGTHWSALGSGVAGQVYALAVFDDGTGPALYVGGLFSSAGGLPAQGIARWNGQTWSTAGSCGIVRAFAIHDDGNGPALYAAGPFQVVSGQPVADVGRWNGSTWLPVGTDINGHVEALASFDDGSGPRLYAGGRRDGVVSGPLDGCLARLDGSTWTSVGTGVADAAWGAPGVFELAVFDDGSGPALYVGGIFRRAGGLTIESLARWNGSAFSAVGAPVSGGLPVTGVFSLQGYDDGSGPSLFVGGSFTHAGGVPARAAARWDGANWSSLAGGVSHSSPSVQPIVADFVPYDDGSGIGLVAVGNFTSANGTYSPTVASWRNGGWSAVGGDGDLRGGADVLATFDSGQGEVLYVGGKFDFAGGVPCKNIARWDGREFTPLGSGLPGPTGDNSVRPVRALCVHDEGAGSMLFAGGYFTTSGGAPSNSVARWDGANWSALGSGITGYVNALASYDDGTGPALFAAGFFDFAGGVQAHHIAKWDGVSWSALGTGLTAFGGMPALALASYDDGTGAQLYVGGHMYEAGGVPSVYLARWNGTQWSAVGSGVWGNYNEHEVTSLRVVDLGHGPKLFVGGEFAGAGGLASPHLARWDGAWSACAAQSGFTLHPITSLTGFDDGSGRGSALYATTVFAGGSSQLARYDGNSFEPFGGVFQSEPLEPIATRAVAAFDDGREPGVDLYVAGTFGAVGSVRSHGLARWTGCGELGTLFCFGDGSSTACPCGNASASADRAGCLNSLGIGGTLRARGRASLGDDTLVLEGASMTNSSALYYQAANVAFGGSGLVSGDGVKCTAGPFVRLRTKTNSAGASSYPEAGDASVSIKGFVTAPGVRHYQVHYRNPALFCTPATFNQTNAVTVLWEL